VFLAAVAIFNAIPLKD